MMKIRSRLVLSAMFAHSRHVLRLCAFQVDVRIGRTNTAAPTSGDLMKFSNHIGENSMAWIDGKTAYNSLLSAKQCEIRVMKDHTTYTSIDHLNNVNAFHRLIEKWYKGYNGVASKYINRYAALFTLAREYTGCDTQEILLSIKKRIHQITDFFRIVDMKKDDLFIYSIS